MPGRLMKNPGKLPGKTLLGGFSPLKEPRNRIVRSGWARCCGHQGLRTGIRVMGIKEPGFGADLLVMHRNIGQDQGRS